MQFKRSVSRHSIISVANWRQGDIHFQSIFIIEKHLLVQLFIQIVGGQSKESANKICNTYFQFVFVPFSAFSSWTIYTKANNKDESGLLVKIYFNWMNLTPDVQSSTIITANK